MGQCHACLVVVGASHGAVCGVAAREGDREFAVHSERRCEDGFAEAGVFVFGGEQHSACVVGKGVVSEGVDGVADDGVLGLS